MHRNSSRHVWPLHAPIGNNSHRLSLEPARIFKDHQHGSVLKPATPLLCNFRFLQRHSAVTSLWNGAFSCCRARFSVLPMKTSSALGLVVTLTSSRRECRSYWTSYSPGEGALT